jgi:hypothetical protein
VSTRQNPNTFVAPLVGNVTPVQIAPDNFARVTLSVYNPGSVVIALFGLDVTGNPGVGGAGTFTLLPGVGINFDGWTRGMQAIAASGTNNPLTIWEYS